MEITEVRIKLIDNSEDRLRGFCSITFDDMFVVRDLKIIEGNNGPFVAMPSRKLTTNCYKCRSKNHLRAKYCNQCGTRFREQRIEHDSGGRAKLYADVAHPVNSRCRELIQKRVIEELERELELSRQPGYASRYDDDYFDDDPGPEIETAKQAKKSALDSNTAQDSESSKPKPPTDAPNDGTSGKASASGADQATGRNRIDAAHPDKPESRHNPDQLGGNASNSSNEEFGKGVFE